LESFVSRSLLLRFPVENYVKLPVKAVGTFTCEPQYMTRGEVKLSVDSVLVYGDPSRLGSLEAIYTRHIDLYDLKRSAHGVVELDNPGGVRLSETEVDYTVEVTRYVEFRRKVFVGTRNVPANVKFSYYPRNVEAVFRCVFPFDSKSVDRMRFYVDYDEFVKSAGGKCMIRNLSEPQCLISCELNPQMCDCIQTVETSAR